MGRKRLTIGVLSPLLAGAYFGGILKGVSQYLARSGGRTIALQTLDASLGDHYPGVPPFRSHVSWENLDGVLAVITAAADDFLAEVISHGLPLVTISHHVAGLGCPEVLPDNRAGMAEAVEHLISHGHSRIAFTGYPGLPDVAERYEAYLDAMHAHGLDAGPDLYFPSGNGCEDGGEEAARAMLEAGLPFTALVGATDLNIVGASRVLRDAGVALPGRIATVGFDDLAFAVSLAPALSTVRQNFVLSSETATRLLVDMIEGRPAEPGEHRMKTSFVARSSCGCPGHPRWDAGGTPNNEDEAGDRFLSLLRHRLHGPHLAPDQETSLSHAGGALLECFQQAIGGARVDRARLTGAVEDIFRLCPRPETTDALMEAVGRYRKDVLALRFSTERLDVLEACQREMFLALHSAEASYAASTIDRLQCSLRNEHYVSMGLVGLRLGQGGLRHEGMRPRSLDWLSGTQARAACLGLWTAPGSGQLRVVSTYGPGAEVSAHMGRVIPEERFPPLEGLYQEDQDVVFVLPVRTPEHDWGMLAVTGPAEFAATTGRDVYFQWAALLGIALDHDAVVESLERQREDLAEAYRRQRELVAEVTASEERYALAASAANDGLWDWDLAQSTVFYSPRWKAMLGYDDAEIGTSPREWLDRVHPDDAQRLRELLDACLTGRSPSLQTEHRVRARDGSYRWALCRAATVPPVTGPVTPPGASVCDGPGSTPVALATAKPTNATGPARPTRMVGSLTDITERKELENRLLQAALYDSLTGLPNRSLFMDRMAQAFSRARRRPGHQFCVLFLDLDGFKMVNDTRGHLFGDLLLVKVAERITAHLREHDTAMRFGGDEFALLLDGVTDPEQVEMVAHRLEYALSRPYVIEDHEVVVTATIGTAHSGDGYESAECLVREADAAMYRAKAAKRRSVAGTGALAAS